MIFVLASLLTFARVHAQLNLDHGPLPTRGGLESTPVEGVLRHAPSDRLIDLRAFGSRAAPLCAHLLDASRVVFDLYLDHTAALVDVDDRPARPSARYGAVRLTSGPRVMRAVAHRFRFDDLFLPADQAPSPPLTGRVTTQLENLLATARRLEPSTPQTLAVAGKFDHGEFAAESLGVTVRLLAMPHLISVLHGEILYAGKDLMIATAHGRRLKLVQCGPLAGTEDLRFVEALDASAVGPDALVAGLEVGRELRVFTRR